MIRKDPMKAGKNVDAGVTVTTPVGSETLHIGETQSQHSQVKKVCGAVTVCS